MSEEKKDMPIPSSFIFLLDWQECSSMIGEQVFGYVEGNTVRMTEK